MLPILRRASFALVSSALSPAYAGTASAQPAAPADPPHVAPAPPPERFRPVALTVNPLSWFFTKFGVNAEVLPAPHHAIVVSPYVQPWMRDDLQATKSLTFAGEVGYHYYVGSRGTDGVFLGPSIMAAHETVSAGSATGLGLAFDVGGQYLGPSGFTAGAGIGLAYMASLASLPSTQKDEMVTPMNHATLRLLATIGYAF
jgi:hypothetical protein